MYTHRHTQVHTYTSSTAILPRRWTILHLHLFWSCASSGEWSKHSTSSLTSSTCPRLSQWWPSERWLEEKYVIPPGSNWCRILRLDVVPQLPVVNIQWISSFFSTITKRLWREEGLLSFTSGLRRQSARLIDVHEYKPCYQRQHQLRCQMLNHNRFVDTAVWFISFQFTSDDFCSCSVSGINMALWCSHVYFRPSRNHRIFYLSSAIEEIRKLLWIPFCAFAFGSLKILINRPTSSYTYAQ